MKILLLGDSLFARHEGKDYPHINFSLKQHLPEITIFNNAISGANSFDLLELLKKQEFPQVNGIFIFIGANDLARHKQVFLGEYLENLRQIVKWLEEKESTAWICLLSPAPVDETKQIHRDNRLVDLYSEIVEQVAQETSCFFFSVKNLFLKSPYPLEQLLKGQMDDGLHFGSLAYDLLAKEMSRICKENDLS